MQSIFNKFAKNWALYKLHIFWHLSNKKSLWTQVWRLHADNDFSNTVPLVYELQSIDEVHATVIRVKGFGWLSHCSLLAWVRVRLQITRYPYCKKIWNKQKLPLDFFFCNYFQLGHLQLSNIYLFWDTILNKERRHLVDYIIKALYLTKKKKLCGMRFLKNSIIISIWKSWQKSEHK